MLLTSDETDKLRAIFKDLDEDNDGVLSLNELVKAFMKTGRTPDRLTH